MILVNHGFDAVQTAPSSRATGMPRPPAQIATMPLDANRAITGSSRMERGRGEQRPCAGHPILNDRPTPLQRQALRLVLRVHRADRFRGSREGGIGGINDHLRQDRNHSLPGCKAFLSSRSIR
jgi:hypothetical protein